MADHHQSTGPPGGPISVLPWAPPPLKAPAPSSVGLPPLAPAPLLQIHQPQHLMHPPPPFSPFPPGHPGNPGFHGNPGFVHGFVPQQQHHYYNVGPRAFPFHSPPPNQGSFGSPPLPFPPPPPQRPPPQIVSGMVSSILSSEGGAAHFRGGNAPQLGQYNRTSPLGTAARSENLGFSKEDEGIAVIEKAIEQTQKENTVDVSELLSQIRALVGQAEEAVQKVGKLGMLEPLISEPHLVTCPHNPTHRVSAKVLFKHFLCCPSNPKPKVDAEKLMSSLHYPNWQDHDEDSGPEKDDHIPAELQSVTLDSGTNPKSSVPSSEKLTEEVQVEKGNVKDQMPTSGSGKGESRKASVGSDIDIWGGGFFYKDSPAVVQAPLPTPYPATDMSESQLNSTTSIDQWGAKTESISTTAATIPSVGGIGSLVKRGMCRDGLGQLLPSRFWFLVRETETWKELPTRCSTLVLQAAAGVRRIRRKVVTEWVLVQGPAHGVVVDSAMASHIHSLARICLKSLQTEASTLIDHPCYFSKIRGSSPSPETDTSPKFDLAARCGTGDEKSNGQDASGLIKVKEEPTPVIRDVGRSLKVSILDCPHLFQRGYWLASQLSSLFGPLESKAFVLKLLKHCLVMSGRILASSFIGAFKKQATEDPVQLSRSLPNEDGDVKPSTELQILEDVRQIDSEFVKSMDEVVDGRARPLEVETAIAAVRERAVLESYLRTLSYPSLAAKFQMIQEHEATVTMAAAERLKRVNYRPVVEHDGLIWHRSQLEEKNKNKTREEILAEERDYKRRRMSYRGKKLKRNPTEVLRDLIGGHMEEIVEAGGIGYLVKHTGGVAPSAETGGVDSSQLQNPRNPPDVEPPSSLISDPMNLNAMDKRGNWNGSSRSRPGRRDGGSSEQIRSTAAELYVDDPGAGSQDNRDSEMEDVGTRDGLRGKFNKYNSHHGSYAGRDNPSSQSRSERNDGNDSKSHWVDSSADHSTKDYRRDRSRSQRYSGSREGSSEGGGSERRQSKEHRGKSRSSH